MKEGWKEGRKEGSLMRRKKCRRERKEGGEREKKIRNGKEIG